MTKKYQTKTIDTNSLAVPEHVSIAMNEIAADMREGLLALAVGAGAAGDGSADGGRCDRGVRPAR